MKHVLIRVGLMVTLLAASVPDAVAESPTRVQCTHDIQNALLLQNQIYDDILYGRRAAADEDTGNTRYTTLGTAWIKVGPYTWRTAARGFSGATYSDADIDATTVWPGMNEIANKTPQGPVRGIFETLGVQTSELITPLLQSMRALQCRTAAVCESVRQTRTQQTADGRLLIRVPGCEDFRMPLIESCNFKNPLASAPDPLLSINSLDEQVAAGECERQRDGLLTLKAAELRLAVAYDASYRSLLQFAGNFDSFLGEFNGSVLTPLQDATEIISHLSRLPCFISQCNG